MFFPKPEDRFAERCFAGLVRRQLQAVDAEDMTDAPILLADLAWAALAWVTATAITMAKSTAGNKAFRIILIPVSNGKKRHAYARIAVLSRGSAVGFIGRRGKF